MRPRLLSLAVLLLTCLPAQAVEVTQPRPNLTILTDESMLLPLAQIARDYASESRTSLTIVVKNAEEAQKQIEQGLEAHLLITANEALIEQLTAQGLTNVSSRKPIARTQLALVTAGDLGEQANLARRISFASILAATPNLPIYADSPATLEGARAQALLNGYEFSGALAARLAVKSSHDEVITALRDAPSLALVLATEAVAEPDIRVVSLLHDEVSLPVTYDVVVLGSELMEASQAFANYLLNRPTRSIFARFGYQPPAE